MPPTATNNSTPTALVTATEVAFGEEINLDSQVVKTISWGLFPRRASNSGEDLPESIGVEFFLAPIRQDWSLMPTPVDDVNILLIDAHGIAYPPDPGTTGPGPNAFLRDERGATLAERRNILFPNAPIEPGLRVRLTYEGQAYDFLLSDEPEGYGGQYLSRDIEVVARISETLEYAWDWNKSQPPYKWPGPQPIFADPTASAALVTTLDAMDIPNGPVVELTPTPSPVPFRWDDPGVDEQIRALAEAHYDWLTFPDGPPSSTTFAETHPYPIQDGAVPVEVYERDGICDLAGMRAALERQEAGGWYVRLRNWRIYDWQPIEASGFEGIIPNDKVQGDADVIDRETGQVRGTFTLFEPRLGFRFSLHYDNEIKWMLRDSPLCRLTDKAASRGGR
jgi:hypothetical protein